MKKNTQRIKGLMALIIAIFVISTAFIGNVINDNSSRNSCTVYVTTSSGNPAYYIKVVGEVCGGISCSGFTKEFRTDKSGKTIIEWSSDCDICTFFIDGKSRKGNFKNSGTYNFSL